MKIAASVALCFSCVCNTFVTSLSDHSGHSLSPSLFSQKEQLSAVSITQATTPRSLSVKGTSINDVDIRILPVKMAPTRRVVTIMNPIKNKTAMFFVLLSRLFRIENVDRNQPNRAATKNDTPQKMYSTAIQRQPLLDATLTADDGENRKNPPMVEHPRIGNVSQAGTFDSLDF